MPPGGWPLQGGWQGLTYWLRLTEVDRGWHLHWGWHFNSDWQRFLVQHLLTPYKHYLLAVQPITYLVQPPVQRITYPVQPPVQPLLTGQNNPFNTCTKCTCHISDRSSEAWSVLKCHLLSVHIRILPSVSHSRMSVHITMPVSIEMPASTECQPHQNC